MRVVKIKEHFEILLLSLVYNVHDWYESNDTHHDAPYAQEEYDLVAAVDATRSSLKLLYKEVCRLINR